MKSVKILMMFLLAGSVVFNACKKKDEPKAPNIAVTGGKAEAAPGEDVTYKITVGSEENKLSKLQVSSSVNGSSAGVIFDTTFSSATNTAVDYTYTVSPTANDGDKIELTFTVTDNQSLTSSTKQTITVKGKSVAINDCGAKTVGSHENQTVGSSFDADACVVYNKADAKTNQDKVDMVYYYGSTNLATLAAPSDASFGTSGSQISNLEVHTWTTRNATMFKKLSGFDFANADGATIEAAYMAATGESTKANNLANGDVVGYKTAAGKYGVVKIDGIQTNSTGTATLHAKTQK